MGRLEGRLRRLERRVQGQHDTPWQARVARMSHEEVQAEVVAGAVALGMPEAEVQADTERAIAWLSQVLEQQPRE